MKKTPLIEDAVRASEFAVRRSSSAKEMNVSVCRHFVCKGGKLGVNPRQSLQPVEEFTKHRNDSTSISRRRGDRSGGSVHHRPEMLIEVGERMPVKVTLPHSHDSTIVLVAAEKKDLVDTS